MLTDAARHVPVNAPLSRRQLLLAAMVSPVGRAFAQDRPTVRLLSPSVTVLPYHGFLFLGTPLGFYHDHGVTVDFTALQGSTAVLQMVASGRAEMGYIGMSALLNAKARQPALPATAVFLQDSGAEYAIGVPEGSRFRTLADLKGARIGVLSLASGAVPWLDAYLGSQGLGRDDYAVMASGAGAAAAAVLRSGRVDALCFSRGLFVSLETIGVTFRYFSHAEASGVIIANDRFLQQHRAAALGVLRGIVLSETFMEAAPGPALGLYETFYGQDHPTRATRQSGLAYIRAIAALWKNYRDTRTRWGAMSDETWRNLVEFGEITRGMTASAQAALLRSLYTTDLIADVNAVDLSPALKAAGHQT